MAKVKQRGKYDYNFDVMADKFENSIYGTLKGDWRLKLIKEDLDSIYQGDIADVWDAGCGMGQIALWLAKRGHRLTCNDISYNMLQKAKESFAKADIEATFYKAPAQDVAREIEAKDLVIFHAVIEWLANPLDGLSVVSSRVKKGGYLSLLFFNQHSIVFRNTLRGGWRLQTILDDSWYGKGKKLTPPHPQKPSTIIKWLESNNYEIVAHTGIRVFHDYMSEEALSSSDIDKILEIEYKYCREETYKDMARYVHILARKLS
jgi:S-adenosylmethionine-dependent methyltransferase